jgi:hypothetical protein
MVQRLVVNLTSTPLAPIDRHPGSAYTYASRPSRKNGFSGAGKNLSGGLSTMTLNRFGASPAITLAAALLSLNSPGLAQNSTSGGINVTVVDPTGAFVPGADLDLVNHETNDERKGVTLTGGVFAFPDLPFGVYRLTIAKDGFEKKVYETVRVQTGRVTDIAATLAVGSMTQSVTVSDTETPLLEMSSSALSDTIDTKQVVNLPVVGRSVMSLANLVPGYNGTFDNLPGGAIVSVDFDGTPGSSNRFRGNGGFTPVVQPRIENVAEMTISTAQLDLSGSGTSAMRIAIVTRQGSNQFHGRLYEDLRNTDFNANSWFNNAIRQPRNIIKLNEFGGSVGGPVIKNKLFFFGTWAQSIQPGTGNVSNPVFSPAAQQGVFSYKDPSGAVKTVNLLQVAGAAGYPSSVLPFVSDELQKIDSSLGLGSLTATSDPNISTLTFQNTSRTTIYYPTVRADYNATDKVRLNLSFTENKTNAQHVNAPQFPGKLVDDAYDYTSNYGNSRIAGFGVDWTIRPTLINQFHAGYLYNYSLGSVESQVLVSRLPSLFETQWNYGRSLYGSAYPYRPISNEYPMLSANDSLTWQRGKHAFHFGGSWYREQDHYWNGPGGEPNYSFGITAQDPLGAVFTSALSSLSSANLANAENLYAELTGRVSSVGIAVGHPLNTATKQYQQFGAYNLDEVQSAAGFWAQDSWHIRPDLTVNYGLRWDIYGDDHDVNGGYSTLPSLGDLWGPTPVGSIFSPGTLGGVQNPQFVAQVHAYKTRWVNPSPAIAIAWSPRAETGFLASLLGKDKTVVRTGFSMRSYTEGEQAFWAFASNSGSFFFQGGRLTAATTGATGTFQPGSLTLGDPLPPFLLTPATYSTVVPAANLFGNGFWGMNPSIRFPYVEQWNFGIQRDLGGGNVIEARYVGNLALHQWLSYNLNEVNTLSNGFLQEFVNAQANLAINQANGMGATFADTGLPGQSQLPIFTAAFGSATSSNFRNGGFITNLRNGAVGALASTLASGSNQQYLCNMVGTNAFPACLARASATVSFPATGAYPINFWEVNPYASSVNYLDASGSSNYHGLQVEYRQRPAHGMQFNANYTLSHSLGIAAQNQIQGQDGKIYYTDRNFRLNYAPGLTDIRHVLHLSGTYDLPFGKGRAFLNQGRVLNAVAGGWTFGTILTMQSGSPVQLVGGNGYATLNNNDPGVYFNGLTAAQLQSQVGVFRSGSPWVSTINPQLLAANGTANLNMLTPANIPGVLGYRPYIYGPHWFNDDLSLNKSIPVRERVRMTLQAEFLNVFNHPTFNLNLGSVQSNTFGQSTGGPTVARRMELRANVEF